MFLFQYPVLVIADNLIAPTVTTQVSKLPVLKRRPSPNKSTLGSGGSDFDTSGGSGDSGFTDVSEFVLFKFDGQSEQFKRRLSDFFFDWFVLTNRDI